MGTIKPFHIPIKTSSFIRNIIFSSLCAIKYSSPCLFATYVFDCTACDGGVQVCLVCFDGYADEHTHLVYCDGCNMAVHQDCYGIKDIKDDFFCDKCLYIQDVDQTEELSLKK